MRLPKAANAPLFLEGRDLAAVSAIDDVDLRVGVNFPHERTQRVQRCSGCGSASALARNPRRRGRPRRRTPCAGTPSGSRSARSCTKSCSGHSPPLSPPGSRAWLISRNSNNAGARLDDLLRLGGDDHALGERASSRRSAASASSRPSRMQTRQDPSMPSRMVAI